MLDEQLILAVARGVSEGRPLGDLCEALGTPAHAILDDEQGHLLVTLAAHASALVALSVAQEVKPGRLAWALRTTRSFYIANPIRRRRALQRAHAEMPPCSPIEARLIEEVALRGAITVMSEAKKLARRAAQ